MKFVRSHCCVFNLHFFKFNVNISARKSNTYSTLNFLVPFMVINDTSYKNGTSCTTEAYKLNQDKLISFSVEINRIQRNSF